MILDTSVIIAIFFKEPGYERILEILEDAPQRGMGIPSLVEAGIVLTAKLGANGKSMLVRFLQEFEIIEIPFSDVHWREAVSAYARFGKGRHKAQLNFGDCMSYATSKLAGQPLLYTGQDFSHTDCDTWT